MPITRFRSRLAASFAAACLTLLALPAVHAQDASLALPERRGIKQYQDTKFPEEEKNIKAAAGFDLPLEVKWEAIAKPGMGDRYLEDDFWTNVYFAPLTTALKQVASDAMGAKALKDKLKKVVITFDKDTAPASNYAKGLAFEDGTLTINFEPFTNSGDTDARAKAIKEALEAKL